MTLTDNPAAFTDVDGQPLAAAMVDALDELAAEPAVQRLRAAAIEMLCVRRGDRLLDVGCGTGESTQMLARWAGPEGSVVGVEPSRTMLDIARRRTASVAGVEFREGDASALELADRSFDAVWCERVLQHVDDAPTAMTDLFRVIRPEGRVVVIDTDWEMHAIHGADPALTRLVLDAWCDSLANGRSGRRLPAMMTEVGLGDVTVRAETMTSIDGRRVSRAPFTLLAGTALRLGAISASQATDWATQLRESANEGRFFWAVTMFAVCGRR